MIALAVLVTVSIIGTIGLQNCSPRPGAQEAWATVAIAPILLMLSYVVLALSTGRP